MSIWAHYPEELAEASAPFLNEPWRRWVLNGDIDFYNVPQDEIDRVVFDGTKAFMEARQEAINMMEDR